MLKIIIALIGRRGKMKKLIIIVAAVLLTIGSGLVVPIIINSEKEGPKQSRATEESLCTQTPIPGPKVTPEVLNSQTTPESTGAYITKPPVVPANTKAGSGKNSPANTPVPTKSQEQPSNWVEEKIQKHRDEIDPDDLADFRRIYPRVDIGYVQSAGKDGYTSEEMNEVKAYLRSTLGGDYERAKELFYKYNHLISEDE